MFKHKIIVETCLAFLKIFVAFLILFDFSGFFVCCFFVWFRFYLLGVFCVCVCGFFFKPVELVDVERSDCYVGKVPDSFHCCSGQK